MTRWLAAVVLALQSLSSYDLEIGFQPVADGACA
jgi:hypothetical protein